jgi:hypothetical protein
MEKRTEVALIRGRMMTPSRRRSHGKFFSFQRLFGKYELHCKDSLI